MSELSPSPGRYWRLGASSKLDTEYLELSGIQMLLPQIVGLIVLRGARYSTGGDRGPGRSQDHQSRSKLPPVPEATHLSEPTNLVVALLLDSDHHLQVVLFRRVGSRLQRRTEQSTTTTMSTGILHGSVQAHPQRMCRHHLRPKRLQISKCCKT